MIRFPESALAHRYLDGLKGIEIGASAHNAFKIPGCVYVDYTDDMNTIFKLEEQKLCGEKQVVDVVAYAHDLPFENASLGYVLSSHVLEHCYDAIGTLKEWARVLKPGGLIFCVIPHKDRTFDKDRPRTTMAELEERHLLGPPKDLADAHHNVWITEDGVELFGRDLDVVEVLDVDDKVGNGFTIVARVP